MDPLGPTLSDSNETDADNDVEIGWKDLKSENHQSSEERKAKVCGSRLNPLEGVHPPTTYQPYSPVGLI